MRLKTVKIGAHTHTHTLVLLVCIPHIVNCKICIIIIIVKTVPPSRSVLRLFLPSPSAERKWNIFIRIRKRDCVASKRNDPIKYVKRQVCRIRVYLETYTVWFNGNVIYMNIYTVSMASFGTRMFSKHIFLRPYSIRAHRCASTRTLRRDYKI